MPGVLAFRAGLQFATSVLCQDLTLPARLADLDVFFGSSLPRISFPPSKSGDEVVSQAFMFCAVRVVRTLVEPATREVCHKVQDHEFLNGFLDFVT